MVWVSDGEETAAFLHDAASGQVAEAVGGVIHVFDQEEGAEKLKAAVSRFGPTDDRPAQLASSETAGGDTGNIISKAVERPRIYSRKNVTCTYADGGECRNFRPRLHLPLQQNTYFFLLFSPDVSGESCDYKIQ